MKPNKRKRIRPEDGNIDEMIQALKVITVVLIILGALSMIAIPVIKLMLR